MKIIPKPETPCIIENLHTAKVVTSCGLDEGQQSRLNLSRAGVENASSLTGEIAPT
jgi:hypothetical protein